MLAKDILLCLVYLDVILEIFRIRWFRFQEDVHGAKKFFPYRAVLFVSEYGDEKSCEPLNVPVNYCFLRIRPYNCEYEEYVHY